MRAIVSAGACEFCQFREPLPATATYVDAFGFAYHLCGSHHEALVHGLTSVLRRRLLGSLSNTSVRRYPKPARPTVAMRQAAPLLDGRAVSGADQQRAREQVGWSLRRLARELDRSYAQVQAAECARRPVDPLVAAWVVRVLSGEQA